MVRYHLFFVFHDVMTSMIVKHQDKGSRKCKCHTRVHRDFIDVFTVPPEAISVIGAMADASFLGGTDAQNIIACESMFLTVRAIAVNGYERGNGPEHVNDASPFVGQFIRTYAYRLFDLAATGRKHIRPQATAILTMCMDEFDRLDLPPPHLDISASVAAVARIVMSELKAQGVADVEDYMYWTNYAFRPRDFPDATSSSCIDGEIFLCGNAFLLDASE